MARWDKWLADKAFVSATGKEKPDTSGLKRGYIKRQLTASSNNGGTRSITKFYEELDKKERNFKSYGTPYDPPEDLKEYRKV